MANLHKNKLSSRQIAVRRTLALTLTLVYAVCSVVISLAAPPMAPPLVPLAASSSNPTPPPVQLPTATMVPVYTVTPMLDGSVIHIVQPGQALWSIAEAYKITLSDLFRLNYMTDESVIFPGEKLIIQPANDTPTITPTQTSTPTPRPPTRTLRPTRTLQPATTTPLAEPSRSAQNPGDSAAESGSGADPLFILIVLLVVVGGGLLVLGSMLRRR